MNCVYKHYDSDGNLIYVGVTGNALTRIRTHIRDSRWFDLVNEIKIEKFDNADAAIAREKQLIEENKPVFNSANNPRMLSVKLEASASCGVTIDFRQFLEKASVLEAMEMLHLAMVSPQLAITVLNGGKIDYAAGVPRIRSVLRYLRRKDNDE